MKINPRLASSSLVICAAALVIACSGSDGSPPPAGDGSAPAVSTVAPTSGSTGVATTAAITATFSEALDPATVTSATFTVEDAGGHAAAGTVSSDGSAATFTPAGLTPLTTYTVTLTTGIRDLAGNPLATSRTWHFTTVTTPSPLITAATLAEWIGNGSVNRTSGDDRVILLDVGSSGYSTTGHIPGAQNVGGTEIYQTRKEGPAADVNMVLDGAHMDAFVHGHGIDGGTTVVFTSSSILNATRAYWMFRYWGFPKEMLKVVDGLNKSWDAGSLTTTTPSITASTYTVKSNAGGLRADLRASLSEMMDVVLAGTAAGNVILDARTGPSAGSYAGLTKQTGGVFDPASNVTSDWTVFEGHMVGAQALAYTGMYDATSLQFKSRDALAAMLEPVGIDTTKTTYAHCRTGVIAGVPFFVLDAILGWPVVNYDGSWSQWGQLSTDATKGGRLAAGSPWRTDVASLSEVVTYNHPTVNVELLTLDGRDCTGTLLTDASIHDPAGCLANAAFDPDSAATSGNQVEEEDAAYMAQ